MNHLNSERANQLNEQGIQLLGKGQIDKALACFEKAIQLDSEHAHAFCNMGRIYYEKGQWETAVEYFQKSIAILPSLPESFSNLGLAFHRLYRMDEAIAAYQKALSLKPDYAIACHNMAFTLEKLGRLRESINWYERAIAIDPNYSHAHSNMGITLLLAGNYKQGFPEYEWRLKRPDLEQRTFQSIQWDGSPFPKKRLLLYPEQGYGDVIQFIRYLPEIKKRGGTIILETHPHLVRLCESIQYFDHIIVHGEALPPVDYHASIASLPCIFETTLDTIPSDMPYLFPPEPEKAILVQTIQMMEGFRVGIAWAGSPVHKDDKNRSCTLEQFYPLTQIKGIVLFSLQKGPAATALKQTEKMPVVDLSDLIYDFADLATAISALDLIISVDTAPAHLAGAMGKITWVMLPFAPDWRWMRDREDSPWYPTVKLFRQKTPGDYCAVIEAIAQALSNIQKHSNKVDVINQANKTAIQLFNKNRLNDAIRMYQRLVQLSPDSDYLHSNLGLVYRKKNDLNSAMNCFQLALKYNPESSLHYRLIAIIHRVKGNIEKAHEYCKIAIEKNPKDADVYDEMGVIEEKRNHLNAAIEYYQQSIALNPRRAEPHRNLAHAQLLKGQLKQGFKNYEWRLKCADYKSRLFDEIPLWKGQRFKGKTLFLCTEQGFGDIIQFIRYAPMIKSKGGTVTFGTFPKMVRLLSTVQGLDRVFHQEPMSNFDYQIPLLSLPAIFETDIDTIPTNIPYIHPPETVGEWISIVRNHPAKLKIGIAWAGSLKHPEDHLRSIPIEKFHPLLSLIHTNEIAFFSLQIGERGLSGKNEYIIDLNPYVDDFSDSAAAIHHLDLVISVDTSTVHLAGAMGKPVWVLIPFGPDWRWMLDRNDSPWYPTLKLFRQPKAGDWESVIHQVVESLSVECAKNGDHYFNKQQFDQAESWYQLSMKINPLYAPVYTNMGVICEKRNKIDSAIDWYHEALFINPTNAPTHKNLAHALLLKGNFIDGFKEYQWRLKCDAFLNDPEHNIPFWQGESLENKTILLYSEQGFGDIIQFIRYAPILKKYGATTVAGTFPNLTRLMETASGVDRATSNASEMDFDYQIHLVSLPFLLKTKENTIPAQIPYFNIFTDDINRFSTIVQPSNKSVTIGLIWTGDSKHPNNQNRSISLQTLAPLLHLQHIRFYCFQKNLLKDNPKDTIIDLSDHIEDFYDTAAAMMCMDAFISVDTAPAHLAGALGKRIWLLLPYTPDWRWMLNRTDSPWYPTMKLMRQSKPGHWTPVIERLIIELADIFCEKGDQLLSDRDYLSAIDMYTDALTLDADHVQVLNNIGVASQFAKDIDSAKTFFQQAVQKNPYHVEAWNNLGGINYLLEKTDAAINALQQALTLSNDFPDAHYNLSLSLLRKGDVENGFKEYEWRWKSSQFPCQIRNMPGKRWNGEVLTDKKLLIYSEQGFGDTLFFLRFLSMISKENGCLILETNPELTSLLSTIQGIDTLISGGDPLPDADYHLPLGSLPHILKKFPENKAYIKPPETIKESIQECIHPYQTRLKIGLVWASGGVHQHLDKRSYGLEFFSTLFDSPGVHFFSLQMGPHSEDIKNYPDAPITDMKHCIKNFEDTSAIISQMDLVITTDTSVAHLAGAMGQKVWVALPFSPDWRWGENKDMSDWYPDMRLFRQNKPDDYMFVVQSIQNALQLFAQETCQQTIAPISFEDDLKISKPYLVHGIGYMSGHTGYNIHSSNFFNQLGKRVPFVKTDLGFPSRHQEETDAAFEKHTEEQIVNIIITYGCRMNILPAIPGYKIGYTVWESTRLPDDWIEPMHYADQLWTPTSFCKQVMINHGFDPEIIKVIPEGVDPAIFYPGVEPIAGSENIRAFKFLNVGKFEDRKCTAELIKAFDQEFKHTKDVVLVLSCHNPFEEGFDIKKKIDSLKLSCPEKIFLMDPVREHWGVAKLYASCDAFLFPTRAEGWGLPIIEALACGLPTIVTNYSGQTEYLTKEMAYLLDYTLEDIKIPFFESKDENYGQWAKPDMEQFRYYLRYIYEHQKEAKEKGLNASKMIHEKWTWAHAAEIAVQEIKKILR
ncbi:MAG: tetratricopeptide repeat protein [Candidatus Magnetomorum sp.]|nr:tetratricopeptide repeat protein [Candidatus Magnetomorum sp.]